MVRPGVLRFRAGAPSDGPPSAARPAAPAMSFRPLPVELRRHARRHPERPLLFWPEGLDWRWAPVAAVAAEVERLAAALAATGWTTGADVAYPDAARPGRICLDLALQASGFTAAPRPEAGDPAAGTVTLRVGDDAGGRGPATAGRIELDVDGPWARRRRGAGPTAAPAAAAPPRPPAVEAGGVRGADGRRWTSAEVAAAAERLERGIASGGPRRPGREILVTAGPLADPAVRQAVSWALAVGAALVLEPAPAQLAATAAWARPTVFLGTSAELAALDGAAAAAAGRWPTLRAALRRALGRPLPLPFGRLHTLLVDPRRVEPAVLAPWRARGVAVVPVGEGSGAGQADGSPRPR